MGEKIKKIEDYLKYDSISGNLYWIKRPSNRVSVGDIAGVVDLHGYLVVRFDKKLYKSHRLCYYLYYNKWPDNFIDHIDGNKLNNKIENLRDVERTVNNRNHKKFYTNTSGKCGVSFCNYYNKWVCYIDVDGIRKNLGYSKTYEKAVEKRINAELLYYKELVRG